MVLASTHPDHPDHPNPRTLVIGNYCHDVLHRDSRVVETLGGAVAFISNVIDSLSPSPARYLSKVGADFAYSVSHPPIVAGTALTTLFHAHFPESASGAAYHGDRVLKRVRACDPIYASEIGDVGERFEFGLAVGVAGEIQLETLERMVQICQVVFVDIQGLIRSFDPVNGTVDLVPLKSTPFLNLLPQIGFLKMSSDEAPFVDIEAARECCCVVVTEGKEGCRVYWKDGDLHVTPFLADQVDPTGAGDSFFGGFVVGLLWGLTVPDAALLGNFLGSFTVGQVGVPTFDPVMVKDLRQLLESMAANTDSDDNNGALFDFHKSRRHDEFHATLQNIMKFRSRVKVSFGQIDGTFKLDNGEIDDAVKHSSGEIDETTVVM